MNEEVLSVLKQFRDNLKESGDLTHRTNTLIKIAYNCIASIPERWTLTSSVTSAVFDTDVFDSVMVTEDKKFVPPSFDDEIW
jgi:hypothetical protein